MILTYGTPVYYLGSVGHMHGPFRVVASAVCTCENCEGDVVYRLVQSIPDCVDGPQPLSLVHVRAASIRPLLPLAH